MCSNVVCRFRFGECVVVRSFLKFMFFSFFFSFSLFTYSLHFYFIGSFLNAFFCHFLISLFGVVVVAVDGYFIRIAFGELLRERERERCFGVRMCSTEKYGKPTDCERLLVWRFCTCVRWARRVILMTRGCSRLHTYAHTNASTHTRSFRLEYICLHIHTFKIDA